jgi:hypothetical protein
MDETDTAYRKFLLERKHIIFRTIFDEDMPELNVKEELTKNRVYKYYSC